MDPEMVPFLGTVFEVYIYIYIPIKKYQNLSILDPFWTKKTIFLLTPLFEKVWTRVPTASTFPKASLPSVLFTR